MVFQPEVVKESQDDGKVAVQLVSRWSDSHGLPHSHQSPYGEGSV